MEISNPYEKFDAKDQIMLSHLEDNSHQLSQIRELLKIQNKEMLYSGISRGVIAKSRLKCGGVADPLGIGEGNGESSFDLRCNDAATKATEGKQDAEDEAKTNAESDLATQIGGYTCEAGCVIQYDPNAIVTTIVTSQANGTRATTLGCYHKWQTNAKSTVQIKCVTAS